MGLSQRRCREKTPRPTAGVWLFLHVLSRTINTFLVNCGGERTGLWHQCSCANKSVTCCGAGSPAASSQGFCACLSSVASCRVPSLFSLFPLHQDVLERHLPFPCQLCRAERTCWWHQFWRQAGTCTGARQPCPQAPIRVPSVSLTVEL